jgi:hypothetical protein
MVFITWRNFRPSDIFPFIVAAIPLGLGTFRLLTRLSMRRAARNWPIVHATVETYYVLNIDSRHNDYWAPVIGYYYEINGEAYSGSVCLASSSSTDNSTAEDTGKSWVGQKIIVRYNPEKPEKSAYLELDGAPSGSRSYADQPPVTPERLGDLSKYRAC